MRKIFRMLLLIILVTIFGIGSIACTGGTTPNNDGAQNSGTTNGKTDNSDDNNINDNSDDDTDTTPDEKVEIAYTGKQVVSRLGEDDLGHKYYEVRRKPFQFLGVQIRLDFFLQLDRWEYEDLRPLFKLAKDTNVTCVQVPICWSDVEVEYDRYSPALINAVLKYCNMYDIKAEILWFGSYMCGFTVADKGDDPIRKGYVPNYIYTNPKTYRPVGVTDSNLQFGMSAWLGHQYALMPNQTVLLEREAKALQYMMDAIYKYDSTHGGTYPVIGIQVENEPELLATRRINECNNDAGTYNNIKDLLPSSVNTGNMREYLDDQIAEHCSAMGMVVKNSNYQCVTRVNLTDDSGWENRARNYQSKPGIDFVGLDPYKYDLNTINNMADNLNQITDNYSHCAENGGEYKNTDLMELTFAKNHGGYSVFELCCTANEELVDWEFRGVYADSGSGRFTKKDVIADRLIDVNKILLDGSIAVMCHDGMDVLNNTGSELGPEIIDGKQMWTGHGWGQNSATTNGSVKGLSYSCQTTARGVGYVLYYNGYIYFASTKADRFTFSGNYDMANIEVGSFVNQVWRTEDTVSATSGITVSPKTVYRIKQN